MLTREMQLEEIHKAISKVLVELHVRIPELPTNYGQELTTFLTERFNKLGSSTEKRSDNFEVHISVAHDDSNINITTIQSIVNRDIYHGNSLAICCNFVITVE